MKKLFSVQIIKQSVGSAWIWWLISVFTISINLFAFPSSVGVDNTNILTKFAVEGIGSGNGIIFITICSILFANVFITNEVDRGTLAILLNTPTTRLRILLSKALVFIGSLLTIPVFVGFSGVLSAHMYGIELVSAKWWLVIALWTLYSFAVGSIAFAIACWFNKSRYMLGISAVVLGAFFILGMLSGMESLEFCKYFTLQTLFDIPAVINGESVALQMIVLPVIAVPLYLAGIIRFLKKDLPL